MILVMLGSALLLLAIVCGLAILVAGGVQLLRLASDEDASSGDLAIGQTALADYPTLRPHHLEVALVRAEGDRD